MIVVITKAARKRKRISLLSRAPNMETDTPREVLAPNVIKRNRLSR
jgi:hypothetical protein